jgi:hypothetical protein
MGTQASGLIQAANTDVRWGSIVRRGLIQI